MIFLIKDSRTFVHYYTSRERAFFNAFCEELNKREDETHRATLIVHGDSSLNGSIDDYKLYINGNIHVTPTRFKHLAPPNSVYVRIETGVHRIVLREYEVKKPNRMESNTLYIEIQDDELITIQASLKESQLTLLKLHHNQNK